MTGAQAGAVHDGPTASAQPVIRLSPRRVVDRTTQVLVALWLLLAVGALVSVVLKFGLGLDYALGVVPLLNLDGESSLGTWVATVLLLSCGLLSWAEMRLARAARSHWWRNWAVLGAVFVLMSLDEVARIHDRVSDPLQRLLGTSGVLYYAWLVPVLVLGVAFLLYQARFLQALGRTGRQLLLAGIVFVLGAAGLEMAQGVAISSGGRSTWDVFPVLEELLEFAGVMLALRALLAHLLDRLPALSQVHVAEAAGPPEPRPGDDVRL